MAGTRQTMTYLSKRFAEAGIRPVTKHGQNFLIDLNLLNLLADSADLSQNDVVLEVGTGVGSLTALLAERAAAVVTVEIDANLYHLASEELIGFSNVRMLQQDVLKNKNTLHRNVLDAIGEELARHPGASLKLVANLPYNVATPVLSNLLLIDPVPASMTGTIQKELADRITATPSTKDYSALSVWMQSLCNVRIVRVMPPSVFWPRPKVSSAIVQIVPDAAKRAHIPDLEFFHGFTRALFLHRRKVLRSVIPYTVGDRLNKPQADEIMSQLGLTPETRAEQLDTASIQSLCEAVRQRVAC